MCLIVLPILVGFILACQGNNVINNNISCSIFYYNYNCNGYNLLIERHYASIFLSNSYSRSNLKRRKDGKVRFETNSYSNLSSKRRKNSDNSSNYSSSCGSKGLSLRIERGSAARFSNFPGYIEVKDVLVNDLVKVVVKVVDSSKVSKVKVSLGSLGDYIVKLKASLGCYIVSLGYYIVSLSDYIVRFVVSLGDYIVKLKASLCYYIVSLGCLDSKDSKDRDINFNRNDSSGISIFSPNCSRRKSRNSRTKHDARGTWPFESVAQGDMAVNRVNARSLW